MSIATRTSLRPVWLIESGVYGDEALPLLEEIRRQGMVAELMPYAGLRKGKDVFAGGKLIEPGDRVVGYGTYPFAQQLLLHHSFVPGAWCSAANLDCATYYPHFGQFLLNQNCEMLPGITAISQCDRLFAKFSHDDRVFARPTSCHKLFVGRCLDRESFATALAPTRYDPATMVVIATPQTIEREWRVVVVSESVISGSQYAVHGIRNITPDFPPEVRQFAESVLNEVRWRPDPVFMLDIGDSVGQFHLIELNSFIGSWLYRCDLSPVVAAASELAMA